MIVKSEQHTHKFEEETTIKAPLIKHKAGIVGHDILKQRKCKCGATITYDLERELRG